MSPTDQRIAIAEACGWTNVRVATILKGRVLKAGIWGNPQSWAAGGYTVGELVPDYLSDLNAMHEAEKTLTQAQRVDYMNALGEICGTQQEKPFATTPQRAEAFLRALNLWTQQPPTP